MCLFHRIDFYTIAKLILWWIYKLFLYFWAVISAMFKQQFQITGDLEKDQEILMYAILGLVGLVILFVILIVVIVLVRRSRNIKKAALASAIPSVKTEEAKLPVSTPAEDKFKPSVQTEPVKKEEPAKQPEQVPKAVEVKIQPVPVEIKPVEEVKPKPAEDSKDIKTYTDKIAAENPDDKLDEIRKRLEEIRKQVPSGPAVVLPKIEAKKPVEESKQSPENELISSPVPEIAEPVLPETEPVKPEEIQVVEEIEPSVEEHAQFVKEVEMDSMDEDKPEEVLVEPVVVSEVVETETQNITLPNGKYLPMKKLSFAEWVELFK